MGICGAHNEERRENKKKEIVKRRKTNEKSQPIINDMKPKEPSRTKNGSKGNITSNIDNFNFNKNEPKKQNIINNTPIPEVNYPQFDLDTPPVVNSRDSEIIPNEDMNKEKGLRKFNDNSQIKENSQIIEKPKLGDWNQFKTDSENLENPVNQKKEPIIKQEPTMYDAIFKCESIKTLFEKGWFFFLTEKFVKRMEEEEDICPMCFLGETNKGKTFIINILTNKNLKSGSEYKTEGISCKFSDFEYSNNEINNSNESEKFLLFDTAGRSEPLLIEPKEKLKIKDDLKRIVESNYRDLRISEEFLKNLLINHSQIIIVVVNQLTLSEQIFLYELKNQQNFDQLFIIHNLFNFEKREDMEDYIDSTFIRSIYFDMSKDYFPIDPKNKNNIVTDLPYYFVEDQDNNGEKSLINHFILGNIETSDPWIKKLNKGTIKLLKETMQTCIARSHFKIQEIFEKELQEENKIDEKTKLEEKYVSDGKEMTDETRSENLPEEFKIKGMFKLDKEDKSLNEFKGFPESKEFNVMGYIPDYIFYKNNKNTEFVIEVECSGLEDKDFSIKARESRGKVHFSISGKKIFPKELNMKDKPFSIYFSVNIEKEGIDIETGKEIDERKPTYQKGIYKKIFKMSKNEQVTKSQDLQ